MFSFKRIIQSIHLYFLPKHSLHNLNLVSRPKHFLQSIDLYFLPKYTHHSISLVSHPKHFLLRIHLYFLLKHSLASILLCFHLKHFYTVPLRLPPRALYSSSPSSYYKVSLYTSSPSTFCKVSFYTSYPSTLHFLHRPFTIPQLGRSSRDGVGTIRRRFARFARAN